MIEIVDFVKQEKENLKEKISKYHKKPVLAIVQVGDNQASNAYVKGKLKDCEEIGIKSKLVKLDENVSQEEFDYVIKDLNDNLEVNGVIVQLPLPEHLDVNLDLISSIKDVDGFVDNSEFLPCTPLGIITYLISNNVKISGMNAVVIGRSVIVGKPMAHILTDNNATVTLCHSKTKDISQYTKQADLIIVATGHRHTLTADMVGDNRPIVIDVGINRDEDNKLCGDCDYNELVDKCEYISPVPRGIGLLTRLMLMYNTYQAFTKQILLN